MSTQEEKIAALQVEFDRLKDRQDRVHATILGDPDAWIELKDLFPDHAVEVVIDKVVAEARQGATAMATIARTLHSILGQAAGVPADDPLAKMEEDELAARRRDRQSG